MIFGLDSGKRRVLSQIRWLGTYLKIVASEARLCDAGAQEPEFARL
jgi:hypothetical protein